MPKRWRAPIALVLAIAIEGCSSQKLSDRQHQGDNYPAEPQPEYSLPEEQASEPMDSTNITNITNASPGWNENLMADDVPYDLYVPANYRQRSVLVLPGWNFSRKSWIENSPLVQYAEQYGYALVLPEMLQTVYASSYYPETELKWHRLPGGQFIKELFLPAIQKQHNLLKVGQHNTLLGLSTGGRGVALIALENPGLFVAGASLSGDFSQENMPQDNLMTALYGSFEQFPERWRGRDNPQARAAEWTMPLYLAHGTGDEVVPESQSRLFYEALIRDRGQNIIVEYHPIPGAGHDYSFWGGQLPEVFEFFEGAR